MPRPRKNENELVEREGFSLSRNLKAELREYAYLHRLTKSEVLSRCLREFLARENPDWRETDARKAG